VTAERVGYLRGLVRDVADFPKPGIVFKDITPLLADPRAFTMSLDMIAEQFAAKRPDVIVGIESRGFIFGAALAARMFASFVPARKPGKLPAARDRVEYALEYGTDALEMHRGSVPPGSRVLVVDDVIATGGTAWAAVELVRRQKGNVIGAAFVIELTALSGKKRLLDQSIEPFVILHY
jgi:adenine phosphoribosyltransferase